MKSSIKGLVVIVVIVMSFVLVQGVYARDLDDFEVATYEGVVKSVNATTRAIVLDTYSGYTFDQMGPLWYWDDVVGIPYPAVRDKVAIDAFYIDCLGVYVGVSVCYLDPAPLDPSDPPDNCINFIELRDPDTLKPLWNPKAKPTSDTAAENTGDGGPIKYDYDHNYDNDYDHNYGSSGPYGK